MFSIALVAINWWKLMGSIINGWLNIYKPKGISSAKAVAIIKRSFKPSKVGHTGTLDLEAEGILPIAIGEATKLVSILIDAKKQYSFTVQFGAKTDTADSAGKIVETCDYIPSEAECHAICNSFIGDVEQIPPAYSALKVNGKRAYKIAREGGKVQLAKRTIQIFDLKCTEYNAINKTASYICDCSKGTYIRTLAEDISLSLQSLGFVIELRRLKVGMFADNNAINLSSFEDKDFEEIKTILHNECLKIEAVLDDIPVLDATHEQVQKIRFGQKCHFDYDQDCELIWIKNDNKIVAIGAMHQNNFKSSRVFNV